MAAGGCPAVVDRVARGPRPIAEEDDASSGPGDLPDDASWLASRLTRPASPSSTQSAPGPGPRRGPPRGVPGGGVSTVDLAGISPTRQSRQAAVNFLAGRVGERYGKRYSNHLLEIPPKEGGLGILD